MEEWRPVVGFEGLYDVSSHGRIRTVAHQVNYKNIKKRTIPSRLRSTKALLKGYPAVNLSNGKITKMRTVHVMVLEAFVGPRPSQAHDGFHEDGNPLNARLDNLQWKEKKYVKRASIARALRG
ncbi:MAG: hypothetical protein EPN70_03550 [Paraburkholderia sp.]|uniref:NUMOD4 domain-containing protein n=1 Tax=Paraburkholderia sp. TaxID=1926495 RepID=UPI001226BCCB|nr:NUMOD4 domain-containing protein [Paraburkholderia sp.]TAM07260.1 MAG: hypothetical protein EPN70_03550 [Paraburkholderia sp.]TAM32601.1 MAG: hypothetical protein EPN59_01510 [Paraburkholderia sp.]